MPSLIFKDIDVLRSAVPSEFMQGCASGHDNRAVAVGESFGRSVVSERTNVAANDQVSCRIDRCVMFFEDSAGMVVVAVEVKIDRCVATVSCLQAIVALWT